jgi:glycosyltransferase involved in cell wall biosynthesis
MCAEALSRIPDTGAGTGGGEDDGSSSPTRHLFIAGCPRSGTSALVFLLNEHPLIALGFERFKRTRALIEPFHFNAEQFFSPILAETDIQGELLYRRLRERWRAGQVEVIGDKVPLYWRVLPELLERFPLGRLVLLVRDPYDVAVSFDRRADDPGDWWPAENDHSVAIDMWNEALERARSAEQAGYGERIFLAPYEALLAGDERSLASLLAFIGLPASTRLQAEQHRLAERWRARTEQPENPEVLSHVQAHRDPELSAWAEQRMARQLQSVSSPETSAHTITESALTPEQLDQREVEREQLLAQMRRAGVRGADEVEVLERRFQEQSQELLRRGTRLRVAKASSTDHYPLEGRRVTFILPHQRHTTGGVYAIEQFASHMAHHLEISVVVRDAVTRPIPGVDVYAAPELDVHALPRGDVLVYPADMTDAERLYEFPAGVGRPVMLLQGYGSPGSPVVSANLDRGVEVVAIAHWLLEDALRHGSTCTYVPYGLDREMFSPGLPPAERPPRVSVMTHRLDWKGLADALEAVALVRAARADVEVVCFGVEPVEQADLFLASPTRGEVAALQRSCAVHVLASWEEGFGMTGAEAIACGAALATTDTRGSRDYALHGHTALVSRPRDPRALADNVLRLLGDAELREILLTSGQRHLHGLMPPWAEAARRMAFALQEP